MFRSVLHRSPRGKKKTLKSSNLLDLDLKSSNPVSISSNLTGQKLKPSNSVDE